MNPTVETQQRTCDAHGEYSSIQFVRDRWSKCPGCQREAERTREEDSRRQLREERIGVLLRNSGIGPRYHDATFENFIAGNKAQCEVLVDCRAFIDDFRRDQGNGLFLIGSPGTGKTHLGAAMVSALIKSRAVSAKITSARELIRRLRGTWQRGATESEAQVIEDFAADGLLVLDEVGAGFGSDGEQVQLFDIIDAEHRACAFETHDQRKAPTVLLSNLTAPMLKDTLGERAYDRLREGAKVLVCAWASHRGGSSK